MALENLKLSIFAFPQKWEANTIDLRVLLVPTGSPLQPLDVGLPQFAGTAWKLRAVMLSGLNGFWSANPSAGAVLAPVPVTLTPPPPPNSSVVLFEALRDGLQVVDAPMTPADKAARLTKLGGTRIRKELPESYTASFAFERSRTDDAGVGDEFGCALRDVIGGAKDDKKPDKTMSWGKVIAYALRQPALAKALGLLYTDIQIPVADVSQLETGGWLYLELDPAAPGQIVPGPDQIRSYAARLPALGADARGLFAAVLFPVGQASQAGYDEPLAEAAIYDDGFAKILHSFQPDTADAASSGHNKLRPATDCGIDLGWDDEQVVIWHNRQLESARVRLGGAVMKPSVEAPLGVGGYRIDVRPDGVGDWNSLCRVQSVDAEGDPAPLVFVAPNQQQPAFSASFAGELTVEPAPVRNLNAEKEAAWLPRYFTRWQGRSLVVTDDTLYELTGGQPLDAEKKPLNPPQSVSYAAVDADIELLYGEVYEFRCRFADLTGGGPANTDKPQRPAPAPTTKLRFLRHVPPKALRIETDPPAPATGGATDVIRQIDTLFLKRPLMGYPDFVFAGIDRAKVLAGANNLLTQVAAAQAKGGAIGVADPDVAQVQISVQVRLPAQDPGPAGTRDGQFREIYRVTRDFAAYNFNAPLANPAPLEVALDYLDVPNLEAFVADVEANPPAGDLPIPRARDVRLRLTPICADTPNRYANQGVRSGLTIDLATRAPALNEADLFVADAAEHRLNAILLQPADHLPQRLAQQLDLTVNNLSFAPEPGHRVVFGASGALRHSLTGDNGVITFAAEGELKGHWIAVITLELDRDWTWDGLQDRSFEIARKDAPNAAEHVVGQIDLRFAVNELALLGDEAQFPDRRTTTRLIFFDAIDPTPAPGAFPKILQPSWTVRPRLKDPAAPGEAALEWSQDIRLPVASAPKQMPKLISAGLALSPFEAKNSYSLTVPRARSLWLQFDQPIADPNDRLFARVLAYGPDPLLSGDITHKLMPPQLLGGDFNPAEYAAQTLPGTIEPDPPQVPIDAELIRVIVPNQPEDNSGLNAMVELIAGESGTHFVMPLPPGIAEDALELFGFWTYEIRVGHKAIWSTAQARFGRPLRVSGVQHPAPKLTCVAHRVVPPEGPAAVFEPPARIVVTAPYATPVYADQKLTNPVEGDPRTRMWVMLYAQVMQADGSTWRNVLLGRKFAWPQFEQAQIGGPKRTHTRDVVGRAEFELKAVENVLAGLALPTDSPLSVLAVELLPGGGFQYQVVNFGKGQVLFVADNPELPVDPFAAPFFGIAAQPVGTSDPLGRDLGTIRSHRILRTSPLTPVPPGC